MSNRDATDTITGYFYQFDHSISKLLELSRSEDSITIEGIEDIDINTLNEDTAIQCKYYAKTEYNHSVIAKPIRLMLNHYKEVKDGLKSSVNYYLYGHYRDGQQKLILPLTKEFLKEHFLMYTKGKVPHSHHTELGLVDQDLDEFLQRLTININAINYNIQLESILEMLEKQFNCSRFQAEHFYYNNALKLIKEIATKTNVSERKISKEEFLKKIDNKKILFHEWFLIFKGKQKLLSNLRKEYFTSLNTSPFERIFLIEIDKHKYSRSELKELLFLISRKWSNISKRTPTPYCPYIYIHNISPKELIEIKKELHQDNFIFVDGYSFFGASFSPNSLCGPVNYENQIKLKIINEIDHLNQVLNETSKTKEVYQFYRNQPYFYLNSQGIKHVSIQFEEIRDIKEII
ncbi:DUF4297 family anti-phage-associated protein [Peribacillus butanolivorans]|uniref:DUF4297 family anti-phage-associated protein n=1 Tax=Peribacillus butanolivorans TaxID=421767 RepID=UPI0036315F5B